MLFLRGEQLQVVMIINYYKIYERNINEWVNYQQCLININLFNSLFLFHSNCILIQKYFMQNNIQRINNLELNNKIQYQFSLFEYIKLK
ncbi:unnamed protein product [Paramecium sonneborni]|uniref:Uncharacterized protein n=1 Tax=Paramecium sonneborni TaxID=65129 RepID=A0A8S1RSU5_9CILI|nr:unnamed protein product [Paramecium sonneborni]